MDLRISIIQARLYWEDAGENLGMFEHLLSKVEPGSTDLVILPEMFTTGFTMNASALAEETVGKTMQWMKEIARSKQCVVTGSIIMRERGNYYNRLVWMRPDGSYDTYDKRHLFRMANEQKIFSAGNKKLVVELKGWRICPLICYDLRFPVWSRNRGNYDCLIYIANWPERRSYAWKQLLIARAIENIAYVIGVNRIGEDGNGMSYSGDSTVIDPKGVAVSKTKSHQESVETISVSYEELLEFRKTFPAAMDADTFTIDL